MFGIWGKIILVGMILGAAVSVKVHFSNDEKRAVELITALDDILTLTQANQKAEATNLELTERIKVHNTEKLAAAAQAEVQIRQAQESVTEIKIQQKATAEQLAVANFTILEAIRDDPDYEDWAYATTPVTALMQLRDIEEGNDSIPAQ